MKLTLFYYCSNFVELSHPDPAPFHSIPLILPELVANVFKHRNRIPRTCCDILCNDPFINTHCFRETNTYHTIRVVRVNLAKRAVRDRLILRVMLVMHEELQYLP